MATAKVLPEAALWTITIATDGTSSNPYMKVGSSDSVEFRNTATFPVKIVFTSTFATINSLAPGATSSPDTGNSLNLTVDYTIYNANTGQKTGGPYAIQFGIGPLRITISASNTSPDPIAIPAGGQIAFSADAAYGITWTMNGQPANVWSPQPSQIDQGANNPQTALAGANGQTLTYSIVKKADTLGGGTVKVGT